MGKYNPHDNKRKIQKGMINISLLIVLIILVNQVRQGLNKRYFDDSENNWLKNENLQSDREDSF